MKSMKLNYMKLNLFSKQNKQYIYIQSELYIWYVDFTLWALLTEEITHSMMQRSGGLQEVNTSTAAADNREDNPHCSFKVKA